MGYSVEPTERRYVKGYGFMSFARILVINIVNL